MLERLAAAGIGFKPLRRFMPTRTSLSSCVWTMHNIQPDKAQEISEDDVHEIHLSVQLSEAHASKHLIPN